MRRDERIVGLLVRTSSADATVAAGAALGALAQPDDVVLLCGDLGAGKTQFVKGMARGLGVVEAVTSPTFNIMLVHRGRTPLFHVDLYRLDRAEQLEDIDFTGTLEAGGVTVVEWGDRFEEVRSVGTLLLSLHIVADQERLLEVDARTARGLDLLEAWCAACRTLPGVAVEETRQT